MPARQPDDGDRKIALASSTRALEQLLFECLERIDSEGDQALEEICREHPAQAPTLRAEVEKLWRMGLLGEHGAPPNPSRVAGELFPAQLGDFRLISRLGGGGMGVVYLAEQASLGRKVAIKLIRPEQMYFPGALERFRREVEAVARMQHPGIVPIYTVGTEGGIPYFAMEWIDGCTLADVLLTLRGRDPATLTGLDLQAAIEQALRPGAGERDSNAVPNAAFEGRYDDACLRLARQVAEALEHAHGRSVIHRDVKPSNIAITRTGRAMLLDFGLATQEGAQRVTRSGSQPGSLPYMSPEQVRGEREIDARTDIYSLGVTLYELFSLRGAFEDESSEVVRRRILAGECASARARNSAVSLDAATACAKAMDRDAARRYTTAADFARDLGNVLARRPTEARPPGPGLHALRWAQRHPATSVASVVALVLALATSVIFAWQQGRHAADLQLETDRATESAGLARREQSRANENAVLAAARAEEALTAQARALADAAEAERQRKSADRVVDYLLELFESPDPAQTRGETVTAKDVLDRGARTILDGLEADPLVRARLADTMGMAYLSLALYPEAQTQLELALDLRRRELGDEHPSSIESLNKIATLFSEQDRPQEATPILEHVADLARRTLTVEHRLTLTCLHNLACSYADEGRFAEAESLMKEVIELARCSMGEDDPDTLGALSDLANIYCSLGRPGEAEPFALAALEGRRRVLGSDHPRTLVALNSLASVFVDQRRFAEAEPLLLESVASRQRVFGAEHPSTLNAMGSLGYLRLSQGRLEEALELTQRLYAARRRLHGVDDDATLDALNNLASVMSRLGRSDEAQPLWSELVAARERLQGADHPDTLFAVSGLGRALFEQGCYEDALLACRLAWNGHRRVSGDDHPSTLTAMTGVAHSLRRLKRSDEAQALYEEELVDCRRVLGDGHRLTLLALDYLADFLAERGRWEQAEPLAREALARSSDDDRYHAKRRSLHDHILTALEAQ